MNKFSILFRCGFVKEPGHADSYEGLKVNFIPGKPPELVCFKGDAEVERVDLSSFSTEKIHVMVQERGFRKKVKEEL